MAAKSGGPARIVEPCHRYITRYVQPSFMYCHADAGRHLIVTAKNRGRTCGHLEKRMRRVAASIEEVIAEAHQGFIITDPGLRYASR